LPKPSSAARPGPKSRRANPRVAQINGVDIGAPGTPPPTSCRSKPNQDNSSVLTPAGATGVADAAGTAESEVGDNSSPCTASEYALPAAGPTGRTANGNRNEPSVPGPDTSNAPAVSNPARGEPLASLAAESVCEPPR
jgi:hypothetical protein